ncbi:RNA polymerase sigma factor [Bacteroides caecimuris]|uniref:RNA polymerase sigma factor n=1 Tax=Bacteroides caecimuris TaxID=1796613 RepID=UPI0025AFDDEC|nr:RNA polymerase sigma factor [Bacteroides caecimuris]
MSQKDIDSEELLINLVNKGDEQAMRILYCRNIRYLSAVCSRYIYGEEDIKDVLQDVFLKIFASIKSFEYRGEGSLKGWMTKITLNETLKFIKNNSRLQFVELKQDEMDKIDGEPNTEGIPPAVIHSMIRELPYGYRTIFNLYVIEGKSHKEIAELLGIKADSSASQLHRAKAVLAEKIKKYNTLNSISNARGLVERYSQQDVRL